MRVPAFCDTCGAVFQSGFVVEDAGGETFAGKSAGPCPVCGRTGHVPEGVLIFLGNAIEVLSAPQRTTDELARLAEILSDACEKRRSPDQVIEKINGELPELSDVAGLVPKGTTGLYSFLSLIVALSSLVWQTNRESDGTARVTVEQAIDHIFEETSIVARSLGPQLKPGIRRNQPCPCGSGKKYKHCCGKFANT